MKKIIASIIVFVALIVCVLPLSSFAAENEDIVILYENDVHCEMSGYSTLAAMKNELKAEYAHVGVVSSGDFLQGGIVGALSKGEYIVRLMNLVGYDAVALGNHEFDFGLERLLELSDMLDAKSVCANFVKVGEGECFEPYSIVSYGEVKVAYIGITTPITVEKTSFPTQFFDEAGNPVYSFSEDNLAAVVQENIDKALAEGADYVIALSHLGDVEEMYNAREVVSNTVGLDAVLDAHSHSVIESATLVDKNGNDVVYTSTGTKFANIGKLVISADGISTELVSLEEYTKTDPVLDSVIEEIMEEYEIITGRKVANSHYDLLAYDEEGNRIIRTEETNLGDLVADAFRYVLEADVGYLNGGGIRQDIKAGEVTFGDLLNVLPFGNSGVVVEVSGETIVKMLEEAVSKWPEESGNFPHVSGIRFSMNTLAEPYNRVYDVKVQDPETGYYIPIDLQKSYKLASSNFILLEGGDGMSMFKDAKVVSCTGELDVEILESYITDHLNGEIGEDYATIDYRILFTEGLFDPFADDGDHAVWIAAIGGILMVITIITVLIIRKRR